MRKSLAPLACIVILAGGTVAVHAVTHTTWPIAGVAAALAVLALVGWLLWRQPDAHRGEARVKLGTGLLVGVLVSGTLAAIQLKVQHDSDTQSAQEERRANKRASSESLRVTLSLRQHLQGIDLTGERLEGVYLRGKDLRDARLRGARLLNVDLTGADLRSADLHGAHLSPSTLAKADLRETDLTGAHLHGVDLEGARLESAFLEGATLSPGAILRRAHLTEARLDGARLRKATLYEAKLRHASLVGTDLSESDLRRTDLRGAFLGDADLRGADLRGAHLSSADLEGTDLRGSVYNHDTEWPNSFDPHARGAKKG